jgi:uncharacterized protein YuzE
MNKKIFNKKGEWDYDFFSDILFFKVKEREYSHSVELKNLVVDVDSENFIVGLQIFNASRFFNIDKPLLRQMNSWKLEASIENNILEIRVLFNIIQRNKIIEKSPILIQEINRDMPDSKIICVS